MVPRCGPWACHVLVWRAGLLACWQPQGLVHTWATMPGTDVGDPSHLSMAVAAGNRLICYNGDNHFVHGYAGPGRGTGLWVADLSECPAIWVNVSLPAFRATCIQPSIATLFGGNVAIIFGGQILSRVSPCSCVRACAARPFLLHLT